MIEVNETALFVTISATSPDNNVSQ